MGIMNNVMLLDDSNFPLYSNHSTQPATIIILFWHARFGRNWIWVIFNCLINDGGKPESQNDPVIVDRLIGYKSLKRMPHLKNDIIIVKTW